MKKESTEQDIIATSVTRRNFLTLTFQAVVGASLFSSLPSPSFSMIQKDVSTPKKNKKIVSKDTFNLTDKEWKMRLTDQEYHILREAGTERSFTSPLLKESREGIFACVGCDLPLFSSEHKYDSGTGWPSFYQAIEGNLKTSTDHKLGYARTEYHCARCGGHHGHLFDDGPQPTGLRYCNNGAVLTFIPKEG